MRKMTLALAMGPALALAGCGSETSGEFTTSDGENAEYTIDEETGETSMSVKGPDGTTTLRSGTDVPVTLPDGFSLLPGSRVLTNTVVNQSGEQATMVMFESEVAADKVIAHFREQAKAAGFDIQLDISTNDTMMIGGERKSDASSLTVTAGGEDITTGQIMVGKKKGG
jgi:hypothetical protein